MKKIKIVNLTLAGIIAVAILLTPGDFYVEHVRFIDYLILTISVLTAGMVLTDKSQKIVKNMALMVLILSVIYLVTSAYFDYDGDLIYKNYRLIYMSVQLSDATIKLFEYLNFLSVVFVLLVEVILIYVFSKIFGKYKNTVNSLSK